LSPSFARTQFPAPVGGQVAPSSLPGLAGLAGVLSGPDCHGIITRQVGD